MNRLFQKELAARKRRWKSTFSKPTSNFLLVRAFFALWMTVLITGCDDERSRSNTSQKVALPKRVLQQPSSELNMTEDREPALHRLLSAHLPNAIRIHEKVISGGQPDGEPAFRELNELGVRTIISVDGAKPDVALARKYGLRYVHLPHGYNGISAERAKELALAVRDLDGPIYIHCHHGKHRSPAAAAVACVANGLIDRSTALSVLSVAGTNQNYVGLFESVEKSRKLNDSDFEGMQVNFPETAILPPLAETMVALDQPFDTLRKFAANDWRTIADHPDRDPVHEVLLLKEHFAELLRLDSTSSQSKPFRELLKESESNSDELMKAIEQWRSHNSETEVPQSITQLFDAISANCILCHQNFRDLPLKTIQ